MLDGVNVLDTVGRLGLTVSVSAAEHVPDIQNVEVLVFVTPLGGAMVAVLVTDICAKAAWVAKKHSTKPNATPTPIATVSTTGFLIACDSHGWASSRVVTLFGGPSVANCGW